MYCRYCNKECKNKNSLAQHEIRCKHNPNKINTSNCFGNLNPIYRQAWNKGLTKETDIRLKKISESLSKTFKENGGTFKGRHHSKETLEKLKRSGGLRVNSGRSKKGWYKGFYLRSTYELVYVIYNLDHNIHFKPCKRIYLYEYNGEKHRYYPDFELDDGTIIEIKGYANEQTKAKINSVIDRPIKVLFKQDLKYAFDYVKDNYVYDKLENLFEKMGS
jgi:hypothetical protein